jgi:hypothetical protein
MKPEQLWPWIVRGGGFAGAMYEVFADNLDRPFLLGLLAAMMGLADKFERTKK